MSFTEDQTAKAKVICFGEVLWDCLPQGLFLGGAPFSVAYHLRRLGQHPLMLTAVGDDFLGEEVLERARLNGLDTSMIYKVPEKTGAVKVRLDEHKNASYEFVSPVAWDHIPKPGDLELLLQHSKALVHGSLALRSESNEKLLEEILDQFRGHVCFDVNLRPPHDDVDKVMHYAQYASLLKLNDDELFQLTGLPDKTDIRSAMEALQEKSGVSRICVTRGGQGASLLVKDFWLEGKVPPIEVKDTVGAGDAFMGAFVAGWLDKDDNPPWNKILEKALALGAQVAAADGAQPDYEPMKYKVY